MRRYLATVGVGLALVLAGCAEQAGTKAQKDKAEKGNGHEEAVEVVAEAICVVAPTEGNTAAGTVRFIAEGDAAVKVVADVRGLKPNGKHGFHIHEFGDISAPDGTATGGHYNPEGHEHAGPEADTQHAGDLGNLEADGDGNAHYEKIIEFVTINGHHNPIVGRGIIVHAGEDDLKTQPTGDAGARIGQGVIGVANPKN